MYNMKLFEILENILFEQSELKELMGISTEARAWMPVILNLTEKYKNSYIPSPKITIIGNEYPSEFRKFPVDKFYINVDSRLGNGAMYDEKRSGYDDSGEYIVYITLGSKSNFSTINHELKHAYQDFMRMSKGKPKMSKSKEASLLFGGDFEKFVLNPKYRYNLFYNLIIGLYYTSSFERTAYTDTVFDSDAEIIKHIQSIIKMSDKSYIYSFYSPKRITNDWDQIKNDKINIPVFNKFDNPDDFIDWACKEIQRKGQKTLKKLWKAEFYRLETNKK